ncbi:NUDIX domain-containing protein [Chryseobacterium sp. G0240]|uniref:NUDIX domain-containing protein n=1 Tax=Chryseobacterium sp. G0240 TaxID=2487066 RepID=UPI000F45C016|nr:NUDIX domain-containing protein [Chryseobacterium sp. G0240]ROI05195.1 NUDIX domain-containing protein [Chryseobacterium sp. G0240]
MKELNSFNVRVYAICENQGKILTVYEYHNEELYCKFPGGGLEFGEGVLDCLHREFMEELNVKIEITGHLYTQEDYLESIFDGGQILIIYYTARILDPENLMVNTEDINRLEWTDLNENPFKFLTDKIALQKLREKYFKSLDFIL